MRTRIGLTVALAVFAIAPAALAAVSTSFTEDFTTQTYMDPAATTAEWGGGELSLLDFAPEQLGGMKIGGTPYEIVVRGDLAYVARGDAGLAVLDISDPELPPVQLGYYDTGGTAWDLEVSGGHAYIADGTGGLCVVDVSDPTAPALAALYQPTGDWRAVALSGSTLFMAAFDGSWRAVDVTDPAAPAHLSLTTTYGSCYGLTVDGMRLYLMAGSGGVFVYDVSDPASPLQLDTYNTAGSAFKGLADDDKLYVADGSGGLLVFTVAADGSLTETGSLALAGFARGVANIGDLLMVSCWDGGLHLVNVVDPALPTLHCTIAAGGYVATAIPAGDTAFVGKYNTSLPSRFEAWRVRQRLDTPMTVALPQVSDGFALQYLERRGDVLFAIGAKAVQIPDPMYPMNFLYDNYTIRLFAFDRSDPCVLTVLDYVTLKNGILAYDLADYGGMDVAGNLLAYCYEGELRLLDVSDPAVMTQIGAASAQSGVGHVALSGTRAFTGGDDGIEVYDISDPTLPVLIASFPAPGDVTAMDLDGQRLYASDAAGTLSVVDVTNPATPATLGTLGGLPWSANLAVDGNLLLLTSSDPALNAIDVADPTAPLLLGTADIGSSARIAIAGDTAFLKTHTAAISFLSTLDVVDISSPAAPVGVGSTTRYITNDVMFGVQLSRGACLSGDLHESASGPFQVADEPQENLRRLEVAKVFDPWFRSDLNAAASTILTQLPLEAGRARVDVDFDGVLDVDLSMDGGATWLESVETGVLLFAAGSEPMWRAALASDPSTPWLAPACRSLTLSWRYAPGVIDAIVDVPADQGGWVRVHLIAAADDRADAATPVTAYDLHRRIDDPQLAAQVLAEADAGDDGVLSWKDRSFRTGDGKSGTFPDGVWEVVATAHARQQDSYVMLAPTVADSTAPDTPPGVFVVTTHTTSPTYWHVSPPDSALSVDNLPPPTPTGFAVAYAADGNDLAWNSSPADDFAWFAVHRGSTPGFTPSRFTEIAQVTDPGLADPVADPWNWYYKVAAVDIHGNCSEYAVQQSVTGVGGGLPERFALAGAAPNPFNPSTRILVDVPQDGGTARVEIFDLRGRRVRLLHDGPLPAGRNSLAWSGDDDAGRSVPGGAYLCRLRAGSVVQTLKVTLAP